VRLEGLGQLKNTMTSSGAEPATSRSVDTRIILKRVVRKVVVPSELA
jgi:hypothetical protein